jgi:hypothetical protein
MMRRISVGKIMLAVALLLAIAFSIVAGMNEGSTLPVMPSPEIAPTDVPIPLPQIAPTDVQPEVSPTDVPVDEYRQIVDEELNACLLAMTGVSESMSEVADDSNPLADPTWRSKTYAYAVDLVECGEQLNVSDRRPPYEYEETDRLMRLFGEELELSGEFLAEAISVLSEGGLEGYYENMIEYEAHMNKALEYIEQATVAQPE